MKRQTTDWDKIFKSYTYDKELVPRIYFKSSKPNSKTKNAVRKRQKSCSALHWRGFTDSK